MLAKSQPWPIAIIQAMGLLFALLCPNAHALPYPAEVPKPEKNTFSEREWDVSKQSRRFPGKGSYKKWVAGNIKYDTGLTLYKKRRYREAIAHLQAARNIYPYEFAYCEILGAAYRQQGELKKAEREFKRGIALNSKRWGLWFDLGVVLAQQKRFQEARAALVRAKRYGAPARRKVQIDRLIASIDETLESDRSKATEKGTDEAAGSGSRDKPPSKDDSKAR